MALPILFVPVLVATSIGFAMLRKIKTDPAKTVTIKTSSGSERDVKSEKNQP